MEKQTIAASDTISSLFLMKYGATVVFQQIPFKGNSFKGM